MDNKILGTLLYVGKNYIGDLTNGKTYNCVALSFGKVKIIDDSGEPFWYSATSPGLKTGKDKDFFAIQTDNSEDKILTDFINGTKNRTPADLAEEKGKVLVSETVYFGSKTMRKSKGYQRNYIEETPDERKERKKVMKPAIESFARAILDSWNKAGGLDNYLDQFNSHEGDTYPFTKNKSNYLIIRNKKSWSIYKSDKKDNPTDFIERISVSQCKEIGDVKIYIIKNSQY